MAGHGDRGVGGTVRTCRGGTGILRLQGELALLFELVPQGVGGLAMAFEAVAAAAVAGNAAGTGTRAELLLHLAGEDVVLVVAD